MHLPSGVLLTGLLTLSSLLPLLGCKSSHASTSKDDFTPQKIPGMPLLLFIDYNNGHTDSSQIGSLIDDTHMLVPNIKTSMGGIKSITVQQPLNATVTFSGPEEIVHDRDSKAPTALVVGPKLAPFVPEVDPLAELFRSIALARGAQVTLEGYGPGSSGTLTPRSISGSVADILEDNGDIDAVFPDTDAAPTTDSTIVNEDHVVVGLADISTKNTQGGQVHVRAANILGKKFAWVGNFIPAFKNRGDNAKGSPVTDGKSDSPDSSNDADSNTDHSSAAPSDARSRGR